MDETVYPRDLIDGEFDASTTSTRHKGCRRGREVARCGRMKVATLMAALLLSVGSSGGQEHACMRGLNEYYSGIEDLTGPELEAKLTAIIKQEYTVVGYSRAWDALSDLDLASPGQVRLIYSGGTAPVQTGCPNNKCEWNREHLWPQSYGVDPEDKNSGASYSDLFNLFPVIVAANSDRSNDVYDQITDARGACLPQFPSCQVPAHATSDATTAEYDNAVWQPPANRRGDIARALMYMHVRYDGIGEANTADLRLVEDVPAYPSNDPPSTRVFGRLSAILQWHCDDPVDSIEKARNDAICARYQHNRNPFIDIPSLVPLVFANLTRDLGNPMPSCFNATTSSTQPAVIGTSGVIDPSASASPRPIPRLPYIAAAAICALGMFTWCS